MFQFVQSTEFSEWLAELADLRARAKILVRLRNAMMGNFGDCAPIGEGLSEMRIHSGPGYRIYFLRRGQDVFILLCGGDKSTQHKDIARAKVLAREIRDLRS